MLLALKEKLQNTVEKILFMKEGEKKIQLYNLSRFTLLQKKKRETTLLEADVDTVSVI